MDNMKHILKKKLTLFLPLTMLVYCGQTMPEFNADSSFAFLEKQVEFGPRNPGSMGHKQCSEWLVLELKKYAGRVLEQNFTHRDPRLDTTIQMTNIVASFNLNAGKRIILCAHWDTRPRADKDIPENRDKPILGANDGASGVAVLLEIARLMKNSPPPIGVDIVLFDGEDYGPEGVHEEYFLGASYFVKNMGQYKPLYGILLDMVGDAQLNLPIEYQSGRYAAQVVEKIWSAAEELGYKQFERRTGTPVNDDHVKLIEAGIPTVDIIDFEYPDETHKYWHTLHDTVDKCSPQSLKAVGQTVLSVVYSEES